MTSAVTSQTTVFKPVVGVLALQGCVTPHKFHIESLGATYKEVRTTEDLQTIDGLILPGGESTTMLKLIGAFDLEEPLTQAFKNIPVWGICAGSILIAKKVLSPSQKSFGLLNITVERNAYGSQLNSFNAVVHDSSVSFIRAPQMTEVESDVTIKATLNQKPIWVQKKYYMATTFHPELNQSTPSAMHKEFLNLIYAAKNLSIN